MDIFCTWFCIHEQEFLCFLNFLMFYLFLTERETEHERGRDRESEADSRLWAVSTEPDIGLKLTSHEIVTGVEVGHPTNWATQAPLGPTYFFLMFAYFWERETEYEGGGCRDSETQNLNETGPRLWAVSTEPDAGLELRNGEIMTWAEVRCLTYWASQMPLFWICLIGGTLVVSN